MSKKFRELCLAIGGIVAKKPIVPVNDLRSFVTEQRYDLIDIFSRLAQLQKTTPERLFGFGFFIVKGFYRGKGETPSALLIKPSLVQTAIEHILAESDGKISAQENLTIVNMASVGKEFAEISRVVIPKEVVAYVLKKAGHLPRRTQYGDLIGPHGPIGESKKKGCLGSTLVMCSFLLLLLFFLL